MPQILIKAFFAQFSTMLTGKPSFKALQSGQIVVQIPYYSMTTAPLTEKKINALGIALTRLLSSSIELRLVQLRYPYLDSTIFAQFVAMNARKYNFLRMQKMTFSNAKLLPGDLGEGKLLFTHLTGLKLELAGRLTTQRSIPRKTVENGHTGSFNLNKVNINQYASKNKLGTFTIKVWLSSVNNS